jgi:hypothetical protein
MNVGPADFRMARAPLTDSELAIAEAAQTHPADARQAKPIPTGSLLELDTMNDATREWVVENPNWAARPGKDRKTMVADPEDELLGTLRELGTSLVAYSPLGRGFPGSRFRTIEDLAPNDWRRGNPRFQGEQFKRNLAIADTVGEIAREKGITPAQLALAWVLAQGEDVVPIPGTSNAQRLEENMCSVDVVLTTDELSRLDQIAPMGAAVGDRYESGMMRFLNG